MTALKYERLEVGGSMALDVCAHGGDLVSFSIGAYGAGRNYTGSTTHLTVAQARAFAAALIAGADACDAKARELAA